ncbi:MAG: class II aldolase/adducin family protein [bacterium]
MNRYPSFEQASDEIISIGRRMYERGLIAATDGNLSVRISKTRLIVTPSGVCKGTLARGDLVVVDTDGRKVAGRREPTSELKMHLRAYQVRNDIGAIAHAHPPYATAFAVAGEALDRCVLPEIIVTIGSVPLAGYGTPSTEEVSSSIEQVVTRCDAFLLKNHGVMAVGKGLLEAYHKLEMVEHLAKITFIASQIGGVETLSAEEVQKLYKLRGSGAVSGVYPGCSIDDKQIVGSDQRTALVRAIADEIVRLLKEGKR